MTHITQCHKEFSFNYFAGRFKGIPFQAALYLPLPLSLCVPHLLCATTAKFSSYSPNVPTHSHFSLAVAEFFHAFNFQLGKAPEYTPLPLF